MPLTAEQIRDGFWFFRPEADFPPPVVAYPEEFDGSARLNLACTQLEIGSYRQRKLVERWCELLPGLDQVRFLWINSRANQALFEAACRMPNLEGLYVDWGPLTDLAPLANLELLRYLRIGSAPSIADIRPLASLHRLVVLEIENFKAVRDLAPLAPLTGLEGLMVGGSMWSTWRVDSLEPLGGLQGLKYLLLPNLRAADGTLLPLARLSALVHLRTAFWWPPADFAMLRERLPSLRYGSPFNDEMIARFGLRPAAKRRRGTGG